MRGLASDGLDHLPSAPPVAICEAPEGGGNAVRLDSESEADSKCSDGGLIAGSRVVKVIRLPWHGRHLFSGGGSTSCLRAVARAHHNM